MILYAFLLFIALSSVLAFNNWRRGLYLFAVIGLLQDPVRKLVPGVPGYLVLSTVPVWGSAVLALLSANSRDTVRTAFPRLAPFLGLFVVSLIPSAVISLTYGPGSWQLTLLGALTYGSVIFSVALGYQFGRDALHVRHFLAFYCLTTAVMLSGTLLEYFGIPFPATGTEMLGFEWVRYIPGVVVHMVAGFFRSPDMMGWHAATVAMLSVALASSSRRKKVWLLVAGWASLITILCGRRKMMYMLPFFMLALTLLQWRFGRRVKSVALIVMLALTVAGIVVVYHEVQIDDSFLTYYSYNPGDIYTQVEAHGYQSLLDTVEQSGFFGGGLGSANTGAHHLGIERPAAWQESGPSRLLVELGVPGFVGAILLVVVTATTIWSVINALPKASSQLNLWLGLLAIVLANAGAFVVSGQVYGDPFLSSLLAIFIGIVLSSTRLERAVALQQSRMAQPLVPLSSRAGEVTAGC